MVNKIVGFVFMVVGLCSCALYNLTPSQKDYSPADPAGDSNRYGRQQGLKSAEQTSNENGYPSAATMPPMEYKVAQKKFANEVLAIHISCQQSDIPLIQKVRYKKITWSISTPSDTVLSSQEDMTNSDGILIISVDKSLLVASNSITVAGKKVSISNLMNTGQKLQISCPKQ